MRVGEMFADTVVSGFADVSCNDSSDAGHRSWYIAEDDAGSSRTWSMKPLSIIYQFQLPLTFLCVVLVITLSWVKPEWTLWA